jgi:Ca-activated chloride channel family protein
MKPTIRFDHELLSVETDNDVHCMFELHVPAPPQQSERAPLRIALVLDRSGSMGGAKLEVAKQCAKFVAHRLLPTDLLSVVAFDDTVDLVAPLSANHAQTEDAITWLLPRGQTNLSGGWLKGLEELRRTDDGVRRVILLTDGQANEGVTDRAQLASLATGTKEQAATTTIGFGEGFDEDLLAAIADNSGGATYFAANPDDAPGIFAEEFEGLSTLVAQNVSVEIRPSANVELLSVLNEYPITEVPGGLQVQIGDAYGDEQRRLLFQFHVPQVATLGPARVADVILRYVSVGDQLIAHETTVPVVVNLVSADEAAAAELDREVEEEVVLLQAARARREATELADSGDFHGAQRVLKSAAEALRRSEAGSQRAAELAHEADILDGHYTTMDTRSYTSMTRKQMRNEGWRRGRGRKS